jgi:hypothetical protein
LNFLSVTDGAASGTQDLPSSGGALKRTFGHFYKLA